MLACLPVSETVTAEEQVSCHLAETGSNSGYHIAKVTVLLQKQKPWNEAISKVIDHANEAGIVRYFNKRNLPLKYQVSPPPPGSKVFFFCFDLIVFSGHEQPPSPGQDCASALPPGPLPGGLHLIRLRHGTILGTVRK